MIYHDTKVIHAYGINSGSIIGLTPTILSFFKGSLDNRLSKLISCVDISITIPGFRICIPLKFISS